MIIGVIMAGGIGSRMGNIAKPKQFLTIGDKPILIHTVEKFVFHPEIDAVIVLTPAAWLRYTEDLLAQAGLKQVAVIEGGDTRNGTLRNALTYIETAFPTDEDHIAVTHDAVRPFLTHRILSENIRAAQKSGACDTVIPATDTIVQSTDKTYITAIPPRAELYQGQTPQSFSAKKLRALIDSLTPEEEDSLTDACKIFVIKGEPVELVLGDVANIKITYPFDVKLAKALLEAES